MTDWNYLAARVTGDGHIDVIESELPLTIGSISRRLSAPSSMTGSIDNEVKRLKKDGRPIFEPWGTVILAVANDVIRGMTIYRDPDFSGAKWTLNQIGLGGYPIGMPYDGSVYFIDADPLDIFREIWAHLQNQPNGNLGVTIDELKSPVRVGTQIEDVEFQTGEGEMVAFEAGPRKLNWWQTKNLGTEIDNYAKETPFDWIERYSWQGEEPHCHIDLGYPTIGVRDDHRRFVLGENIAMTPSAKGGDWANQTYVLGAGEGRDRVRGFAGITTDRLRRATVVEDKSKRSIREANALATDTLQTLRGELVVETIEVFDHPNAPLEGIELGNEYPLFAETDHAIIDQHVRVVARDESPTKGDSVILTVVRSVNL